MICANTKNMQENIDLYKNKEMSYDLRKYMYEGQGGVLQNKV